MDPEAAQREGPPKKQFPFDDRYDFSYRPATYWPELPTENTLLSKIKGTQRRDIARRALEGEKLQRLGGDDLFRETAEFVLDENLDEEERESWGGIHPTMTGGEYLPADLEDEIEVARIELASTTGDVIQLRAQPSDGRIVYRVVDEYWDEGSRYAVTPEESAEPLTFGQLIELLDTARQADEGHLHEDDAYNVGLADKDRAANYDEGSDAEGLIYFATVSSLYYPQLEGYYRDRARAWYEQILLDQLDDEVSTALLVSRRAPVRPVSPADYDAERFLLPTRRGAPNRVEAVVDKVALERWMRYIAGLDGFELYGSYEREALWVGRLVRVEARWRDEEGA
jgi:hypothetical protein